MLSGCVGWVERSETRRDGPVTTVMGFAALNPSYEVTKVSGGTIKDRGELFDIVKFECGVARPTNAQCQPGAASPAAVTA